MRTNDTTLWEKFDPVTYVRDNYAELHDEDRQIIEILVHFYNQLPRLNRSVEIGGGPNLYPLMLALPVVQKIEVIEYSSRNIKYLKNQLGQPATAKRH